MIFEFYEGKNVKLSNIYDRFLRITDPFYIPTGAALKHRYKVLGKRISKGQKIFDEQPMRHKERFEDYLLPGFQSKEFKILDNKLLEDIKNYKGEFFIDRYIVEWNTKKYFLKRYKGTLHRIEGNITIFFFNQYDIILEDNLPAWKRNNILNKLV